jgi:probable HAF family extracellular repeat protein
MKVTFAITITALLAGAGAGPIPGYILTDLGSVGPAGQALYVNRDGMTSGAVATRGGALHAVLWFGRNRLDLATRGLGGANSIAFAVNASGVAVGGAETAELDPTGIDFCGFAAYGLPTAGTVCAPFVWRHGVMEALPTLGGRNGTASQINRWGVIAGEAETTLADPGCPERAQFKPVVWQNGSARELPTLAGDPDAVAYAINDRGQVVGSSGTCAPFNPQLQLALQPLHPTLWQPDGTPISLGSLGGSGNTFGHLAININNSGHVVGTSEIADESTSHAFVWTRAKGISDLGTLPGDIGSGAVGINDSDTITGLSIDSTFVPRAVVWRNGGGDPIDLNQLVVPGPLHLLTGTSINAAGEIVGLAVDTRTGEVHAYRATPVGTRRDDRGVR